MADDHYATIVSAVEYGRTIYDNIRNAVIFFLSSNFDEVLLIGTTFLLGLPLPLLTLQILWINIVSDSFPALAFAFETPTARTLHDKPRSSEASSMRRPILFSFVLAVIAFIIGLTIFLWGLSHSIEKARTLVFMSSVLVELVYAFSLRSPRRIWQDAKSFIANKYMIGALILSLMMQAVVFIPSLSEVFGVVPLSLFEWLVLLICTLAAFMSAEVVKWYLDKHQQALSGRGIVAAKSGI
ncbi:MAG: Calcium-transporting ATPase 1 [bacterium ADurb.Bin400]|nr:MAG: Calcium-transporting ATPase 1 [bacterium ADurb.Bin400]